MKSRLELYQTYSFESAKEDLIKLIETSFRENDKILIPNPIMTCFSYNREKTESFFNELRELDYEVEFKTEGVYINCVNKDFTGLVSYFKSGIGELLGDELNSNTQLVLQLMRKHPNLWKRRFDYKAKDQGFVISLSINQEDSISIDINNKKIRHPHHSSNEPKVVFLDNQEIYLIQKEWEKIQKTNSIIKKTHRQPFSDIETLMNDHLKKMLKA